MHSIYFEVPLTKSLLFDMHAHYLALKLRAKFPGLSTEFTEEKIVITGELNDYWFERWNRSLFELGTIDTD